MNSKELSLTRDNLDLESVSRINEVVIDNKSANTNNYKSCVQQNKEISFHFNNFKSYLNIVSRHPYILKRKRGNHSPMLGDIKEFIDLENVNQKQINTWRKIEFDKLSRYHDCFMKCLQKENRKLNNKFNEDEVISIESSPSCIAINNDDNYEDVSIDVNSKGCCEVEHHAHPYVCLYVDLSPDIPILNHYSLNNLYKSFRGPQITNIEIFHPESFQQKFCEVEWLNEIDECPIPNWKLTFKNNTFDTRIQHFITRSKDYNICCDCKGKCWNTKKCACSYFNYFMSGSFSYTYDHDHNYDVSLPNEYNKTIINCWVQCFHVFECGLNCKCNEDKCSLSLYKLINPEDLILKMRHKFQLKRIVKSKQIKGKMVTSKMWGLFTKVNIPKNTFVIEYTGEIITNKEANIRGKRYDAESLSYLFDICGDVEEKYMDLFKLYLKKNLNIKPFKTKLIKDDFPLVIDAKEYGSLARFINHSCKPNLRSVNVHFDSKNPQYALIMLFSLEDIKAGTELTIDYNYNFVENADDVYCLCGEKECKIYLYKGIKTI